MRLARDYGPRPPPNAQLEIGYKKAEHLVTGQFSLVSHAGSVQLPASHEEEEEEEEGFIQS